MKYYLIAVNRGRGLPIILKVMGLWRTTHMNIIILASYVLLASERSERDSIRGG